MGGSIPGIKIAHATSCMKVEIRYPTDNSVGYLSFTLANKKGEAFDWDGSECVRLGIVEMARALCVLRGECESIDDSIGDSVLLMRHIHDPKEGCAIGIKRGEERRQILLDRTETVALSCAIESSFFFVSFVKGVS